MMKKIVVFVAMFAFLAFIYASQAVPVTAGLGLHLDAGSITGKSDGDVITTWQDISDNSKNATAIGNPTYRTNVINGRPVVRFDGNDSFSSPLATTQDMTIFVVTKGSCYWSLIRWQPSQYFVYHWHDYRRLIQSNNGGTAGIATGLVDDQWNIGTVIVDTGVDDGVNTFCNGTLQDTTTYHNSWGPLSPLYIGSYGGSSEFMTGDIAEILIYSRALDTNEHLLVGAYLSNKYGLATAYDVNVLLKANTPSPADTREFVEPDVNLSWTAGLSAVTHKVFLGNDFNDVNQAVAILGDIDGNGIVNSSDLLILSNQWLSEPNDQLLADRNDDNNVDFADFAIVADGWQKTTAYKGSMTSSVYDPGILNLAQQYYWRVDEVNGVNTVRGNVWGFKTIESEMFRLFPQGSLPSDTVDVVNLTAIAIDYKLAAITLQGQINKSANSQVYFLISAWDQFWLNWLVSSGHIKHTNNISVSNYFNKYSSYYSKVIVYDPDLISTINIATMKASLENAIVIHPDYISSLGTNRGKTVEDLRGLWTRNVDAYQWAFDNLWPSMNHKILACYHPTALSHPLRDYLIQNKIFTFWITSDTIDAPPKSDYNLEKAFAEQLFAASPINVPVIGFWYAGEVDPGISEYEGVKLSGKYGKLTTAADWSTNLSLISGTRIDIPVLVNNYKNRAVPPCPTLDNSKVYICFNIVESGDAPAYWQYRQYEVWQDPNRGVIPVNWSLGPGTMEIMPAVMEWFYTHATPNDSFYLCLSGAGYVYPYIDFMSGMSNPDVSLDYYLELTQYYMDLLGIKDVGLYTTTWGCFDRNIYDSITLKYANGLRNLDSLILGMGRDNCVYPNFNYTMGNNNVLISHIATRWDQFNIGRNHANNVWLANEIRNNTPTSRPAVLNVMALSWSYYPSDLLDVMSHLGDEYIAVTPDNLKNLYHQMQN